MIVGLTGTNGAGKTAVSEMLRERGYGYQSLSDEIRAELKRRGLPATRENLIAEGIALRSRFGPAALAERVAQRLNGDRDWVVDSVRNPHEVAALRRDPGFRLLFVDAPPEIRYERTRSRADERTPGSFEQFQAEELRETTSDDPAAQQLHACQQLADETLWNDADLGEVERRLDLLLARWRQEINP